MNVMLHFVHLGPKTNELMPSHTSSKLPQRHKRWKAQILMDNCYLVESLLTQAQTLNVPPATLVQRYYPPDRGCHAPRSEVWWYHLTQIVGLTSSFMTLALVDKAS